MGEPRAVRGRGAAADPARRPERDDDRSARAGHRRGRRGHPARHRRRRDALDAFELMAGAAERAGRGLRARRACCARVDLVLAPRGIWTYRDPGRVVAERFGASDAAQRRRRASACSSRRSSPARREAVAGGDADVVLVCGTEAKHRSLLADEGRASSSTTPTRRGATRTRCSRRSGEILTPHRDRAGARGAGAPVRVDRKRDRATPRAARRSSSDGTSAELWARFAAVAAGNPRRVGPAGPERRRDRARPAPGNRAIAMPYTKLLCSQWNVDQAAAIVADGGRDAPPTLGVAARPPGVRRTRPRSRTRWSRCRAGRRSHRWPAFEAVVEALGLTDAGRDRRRRSSTSTAASRPRCRCRRRALGLPIDAPLTVSGRHDVRRWAAQQLGAPGDGAARPPPARGAGRRSGLITSVSGMITKPGASTLVGDAAGRRASAATDVTEDATEPHRGPRRCCRTRPAPRPSSAHTVVFDGGEPARAVAVARRRRWAHRRPLAATPTIATSMTEADWVGRSVPRRRARRHSSSTERPAARRAPAGFGDRTGRLGWARLARPTRSALPTPARPVVDASGSIALLVAPARRLGVLPLVRGRQRLRPEQPTGRSSSCARATSSTTGLFVGPYSRYGWNHPGPLLFYVLAVPYKLLGDRVRSRCTSPPLLGQRDRDRRRSDGSRSAAVACRW